MPEKPRSHFNYDDRCAIEEGVRDGLSASAIARRLDVSPSSVTREVKSNRWAREPKRKSVRQARKCGAYNDCRKKRSVCAQCLLAETKRHSCKLCPAVVCCDLCPDFVPRECPAVTRWPYVCACAQSKKSACDLPKFRYDARRAQEMADARRSESREGVSITEEELARMLDIVVPLIENGLSPEAVWMSNPDLPVGCRTFRSWMESGIVPIPAIALPRKARCRPRKKKHGPAAARPGREYADFLALSQEERGSAVEVDSVIGYAGNQARILSFHAVRAVFQFYLRLEGPGSAPVVEACDMLEQLLGGPELFRAAFGVMVVDRGEEFADWEGIERSCLIEGANRCHVYYCDPMRPSQKGHCERNHAELRRILPKGRSDFDALTGQDLSLAASHISSNPRASLGGKRPIDVAAALLPEGLLDALGITAIPIEEVILKPSLLAHAVER